MLSYRKRYIYKFFFYQKAKEIHGYYFSTIEKRYFFLLLFILFRHCDQRKEKECKRERYICIHIESEREIEKNAKKTKIIVSICTYIKKC